jgi:two-component system, cell cycle sensor histidine kinase and response regulator CckA
MSKPYENDRRLYVALILLSLGFFFLESVLKVYGFPSMPLRFGLKSLATFMAIAVFASVFFRYRADRLSLAFVVIAASCISLTRAFDLDKVRSFGAELFGMSIPTFSTLVDTNIEKMGIYCVVLSLISLLVNANRRRTEAINVAENLGHQQDKLELKESAIRTILHEVPTPIAQISEDGRLLMTNRAFLDMLGYDEDSGESLGIKSLIEPDDREQCDVTMEKAFGDGERSHTCHIRFRHRNGFPIWVRNRVRRIDLPESDVKPFIVLGSEDVTEPRRRMIELTESVSLLEATFESTADGILIVDVEGRILRYNQRFLSMWRIPPELIGAMTDQQAITFVLEQLEDPTSFVDGVKRLYKDRTRESYDELLFKDGRIFERYSKPQFIDGVPTGRVWSFRDVTTTRQAENDLKRLENRIREAQKVHAVGTLAAGVAHDFNNILSSIVANTETALNLTKDSEPIRECLNEINDSCTRSQDLIDRILSFTRKGTPKSEVLSVGNLLTESEKLMRPALLASTETRVEVEDNLPCVLGDSTQFHQVLLNLCANSIAAIGKNAGLIEMRAGQVVFGGGTKIGNGLLPAGRYVRIGFRDTGRGMTEGELRRASEPFYSTQHSGAASGLGLTAVVEIVSSCRGAMQIESRLGEGTLVELYLPAILEPPDDRENSPRARLEPVVGNSERILLLDDEPSVVRSLERLLRQLNYVVEPFTDPAAVLTAVKDRPEAFDLLLTDLTMPGMSGVELAGRVRSIRRDLPMIVMTGYGESELSQLPPDAGFSSSLAKPIDTGQLTAAIKSALAERKSSTGET